jgi:hypothetical protein
MIEFIVGLLIGAFIGLLIGRRNPSVAALAAAGANAAVDQASKLR